MSIIGTTLLLKFIEEINSKNLYKALVSYWILVCVSFGVQMLYTLIRLYKTFKKVYKGSIEKEDKQILFYLVIFAIVYLFMALSNLFRLIDDLFDTNEFSLAAYFLEDFLSINYLAWIHHMNYDPSGRRESQVTTQNEESE